MLSMLTELVIRTLLNVSLFRFVKNDETNERSLDIGQLDILDAGFTVAAIIHKWEQPS